MMVKGLVSDDSKGVWETESVQTEINYTDISRIKLSIQDTSK